MTLATHQSFLSKPESSLPVERPIEWMTTMRTATTLLKASTPLSTSPGHISEIFSMYDLSLRKYDSSCFKGNMLGKAALNGNELLFVPGLKEPWVAQKLIWNGESFDFKESYETGMEGYVTFPLLFDASVTSCNLSL